MAGEEGGRAAVNRRQRLAVIVGSRHGDQIRPDSLNRRPQHSRDSYGIPRIASLGEQCAAHRLPIAAVVLIVDRTFLLEQRPTLHLAPKGAPCGEPGMGANRRTEVGAQQRVELKGRAGAGLYAQKTSKHNDLYTETKKDGDDVG